jgi:hypothetical protein
MIERNYVMKRLFFALVLLIAGFGVAAPQVHLKAQTIQTQCGEKITGNFTRQGESIRYVLTLSPGDKLTVVGSTEDGILYTITVLDPTGLAMAASENNAYTAVTNPFIDTGEISAYGLYTIVLYNGRVYIERRNFNLSDASEKGAGSFQVQISCVLRDGRVVNQVEDGTTPPVPLKPETVVVPVSNLVGNSLRSLGCGEAFTTEMTRNVEIHTYSLQTSDTDKTFQVNVATVGSYFRTHIVVIDKLKKLAGSSNSYNLSSQARADLDVSQPGLYTIFVANAQLNESGQLSVDRQGGIGIYTILITCVSKDGTVIAPDPNKIQKASVGGGSTSIDVTKLIQIPMGANTPMSGGIPPTNSPAYGYTFDGKADTTASLTFTRLTGNLNVGVAVVTANGATMLFQSSLMSAQTLSAEFAIPADGQYIVAVYRLDPVPDGAQTTTFTVQVTPK